MKKFDLKLRFGQMTTSEMQTMSAMIEKFSVKKKNNADQFSMRKKEIVNKTEKMDAIANKRRFLKVRKKF